MDPNLQPTDLHEVATDMGKVWLTARGPGFFVTQ